MSIVPLLLAAQAERSKHTRPRYTATQSAAFESQGGTILTGYLRDSWTEEVICFTGSETGRKLAGKVNPGWAELVQGSDHEEETGGRALEEQEPASRYEAEAALVESSIGTTTSACTAA
jgi:hypothetical protein